MKKFLFFLMLFIFSFGFSQKVKLKDGIVTIDKVEFLKYEEVNSTKYFFSTLSGEEFLTVTTESFGTGKYTNFQYGKNYEIRHFYSVFKFLGIEDLKDSFEVDEGRIKELIIMMKNSNIIVDGKLSIDNAKKMIEKYSENVSERRFLTKN